MVTVAIHVVSGSIGILAGFASMLLAKGTPRHRLAGQVYVIAMLAMTASAFVIAIFERPNKTNALAAMLTAYLVTSAWLTMRARPERPGALGYVASAVGAAAALFAFTSISAADAHGLIGAVYVFGSIAALSVASDMRLWIRASITPFERLVRHLWRMGFTLFVATVSLFLGQMKHLPTWVTGARLNVVIALASLLLLLFWIIRVRFPPWRRRERSRTAVVSTSPR